MSEMLEIEKEEGNINIVSYCLLHNCDGDSTYELGSSPSARVLMDFVGLAGKIPNDSPCLLLGCPMPKPALEE